jgi:hypothetical protein
MNSNYSETRSQDLGKTFENNVFPITNPLSMWSPMLCSFFTFEHLLGSFEVFNYIKILLYNPSFNVNEIMDLSWSLDMCILT